MALFQLTSNVLIQDELIDLSAVDVISWSDVKGEPAADIARISHVVNWFESDYTNTVVQTVTAETIRTAASFAGEAPVESHPLQIFKRAFAAMKRRNNSLRPKLIASVANDEPEMVPTEFQASRPLTRTVLDIRNFDIPRRLPLLFDILQRGGEVAHSDGYLVFTNSDICLVPHFYRSIRAFLSLGIDCLLINRRIVGKLSTYSSSYEVALTEVGGRHGGFDCFVFPVGWVKQFTHSDACVGAGWVMRSLLYNLVSRSKKLCIMRDSHLTYHFGNDEAWADSKLQDYVLFNRQQAESVFSRLCEEEKNRELLSAFCSLHHPDTEVWALWLSKRG